MAANIHTKKGKRCYFRRLKLRNNVCFTILNFSDTMAGNHNMEDYFDCFLSHDIAEIYIY